MTKTPNLPTVIWGAYPIYTRADNNMRGLSFPSRAVLFALKGRGVSYYPISLPDKARQTDMRPFKKYIPSTERWVLCAAEPDMSLSAV